MERFGLFIILLLVSSCARLPEPELGPPPSLQPYATVTLTATPERPEGLEISLETPLPSPTPFKYTVQAGDTFSQIAEKFGVSLDALLAANPEVSPNSLSVGTEIDIPSQPANPTGDSTPTPVPAPVQQVLCHPTADRGLWCFVLVFNDTSSFLENLSAQVTLVDASGRPIASAPAIPPLNILPPQTSLPLTVFFAPKIPAIVNPRAQILTGVSLQPGDERYLPATIHNTVVEVEWGGRWARVNGQVLLPADAAPASLVWVAAVAYDEHGRVVGVRRWESGEGLAPGGSLPFAFEISSLAGKIVRVEFAVEARP